jgi:hypothetical protein
MRVSFRVALSLVGSLEYVCARVNCKQYFSFHRFLLRYKKKKPVKYDAVCSLGIFNHVTYV